MPIQRQRLSDFAGLEYKYFVFLFIRYIYSFIDDLLVTTWIVPSKQPYTISFCFAELSTTTAIILPARTSNVLLLVLAAIGTTLSDHSIFSTKFASFDFRTQALSVRRTPLHFLQVSQLTRSCDGAGVFRNEARCNPTCACIALSREIPLR
jgi:hypothetical protein